MVVPGDLMPRSIPPRSFIGSSNSLLSRWRPGQAPVTSAFDKGMRVGGAGHMERWCLANRTDSLLVATQDEFIPSILFNYLC